MLKKESILAKLFLAPALFLIAAVALYPILNVIYLSLHRKLLIFDIHRFIGLENYAYLLQDARFWRSLGNTFYFVLLSTGLEMLLGLITALVMHQPRPGKTFLRAAILVPWAIPTVVSARMWEWIFNPDFGVLNFLLHKIGLLGSSQNWLGDPGLALHAVIFADVWKTTPFVALLLFAGLQVLPADIYEAARIDGANAWQRFRRVTLPLLMPVFLTTLLFRTLDAFRIFDSVYVLTGGGPANTSETLSIYAYKLLFQTLQFGAGSAVAVLTFGCVMIVSLFYIKLLTRGSGKME
ncbi:MAG: carbohydrate ABC transporter permease [bacterium]